MKFLSKNYTLNGVNIILHSGFSLNHLALKDTKTHRSGA